jgi:uncharacterized protein (TIGR03435 family)
MAVLATTLSRTYVSLLGRNVIDATGLTGVYDVQLKWAIDSLSAPAGPDATPPSDERVHQSLPLCRNNSDLNSNRPKVPSRSSSSITSSGRPRTK